MNAIEICGLTKTFPGFRLEPFDLTLPSGCVMGLIGENGAGKSTVMKLIVGSLKKDSGSIRLFGSEDFSKEDIGYVPDEIGFPDCVTAAQVGKIMANSFRRWDGDVYERLLRRFSLPADKVFGNFSRGMKMKLGIAVALSHRAKLLLLDEATSGLDPVVRDEVVGMLGEFTRDEDHSVLISSHIVSDLEKLCDYVTFLLEGRVLLCEEKDRLLEEYAVTGCSQAQFSSLDPDAVLYKTETPYGVKAIVRRNAVPTGLPLSPVDLEELFVVFAKGAKR